MILTDLQKTIHISDDVLILQKVFGIGFSILSLYRLKSYLTRRSFLVNLGKNFFQRASVSCDVPQGSILGRLLFLIYLNYMSQAIKCKFFISDDSCLVCQHRYIKKNENQLNADVCIYAIGLRIIS